ncbi:ABC transporter ATP-binding protein, partial [bacterium]
MTENHTFIQIRDLHKTFVMGRNIVRALDGVDLDIPINSFTVVMGPSGSGKSTLLYLLGGLDRVTSGSIRVDGQKLEKMDENDLAVYRRREVGFIFQSFNLVSSMTALENVSFPMRFAGISGKARKQRATGLLKQVGLENRARHKPTELSGGQQQRVAVARALVNNPRMIL